MGWRRLQTEARRGFGLRAFALVVLAIVICGSRPGKAQAVAGAAGPPPDASVTAAEAQRLREAQALVAEDVPGAIAALEAAVSPQSSAVYLDTLGVYCQRAGRLREAADAFAAALARDPGFRPARENLAKTLLQEERYDEALTCLLGLLDGPAAPGWARLAAARILLQREAYAEAAQHLAELLERSPQAKDGELSAARSELWRLLGFARLGEGYPVAAETAFRNALALAPDDKALRVQLLQSVLEQGNLSEACALAAREIARDPLQVEMWRVVAGADYEAGRTWDALVRLECTSRLGIAEASDLADLGDLLMSEDLPAEALARYRAAAALDAPPVERLLRAAGGFVALGRAAEAAQVLETVDRFERELTTAQERDRLEVRAQLAQLQGAPDRALELYRALLAQAPLDGGLLLSAGRILQQQGKFEEALVCYERATRASADHKAEALLRQAQIAVERGDYAAAETLLTKSVAVKPRAHVERYLEQVRRLLE